MKHSQTAGIRCWKIVSFSAFFVVLLLTRYFKETKANFNVLKSQLEDDPIYIWRKKSVELLWFTQLRIQPTVSQGLCTLQDTQRNKGILFQFVVQMGLQPCSKAKLLSWRCQAFSFFTEHCYGHNHITNCSWGSPDLVVVIVQMGPTVARNRLLQIKTSTF